MSWSEVWGDEATRNARFKKYEEEHPISAKEILRQLALFSRLFYDVKSLEKYGFSVKNSWNDVSPPCRIVANHAEITARTFKAWTSSALSRTKTSA